MLCVRGVVGIQHYSYHRHDERRCVHGGATWYSWAVRRHAVSQRELESVGSGTHLSGGCLKAVTFRWTVSPGLSLWPLCRADLHSSLGPRTRLFQVAPTRGASPVLVSHGQVYS